MNYTNTRPQHQGLHDKVKDLIESGAYPLTERLKRFMLQRRMSRVGFMYGNAKRELDARAKIADAVWQLIEQGKYIGRCAIEKLTGCHIQTIRKHWDIVANALDMLLGDACVEQEITAANFKQDIESETEVVEVAETPPKYRCRIYQMIDDRGELRDYPIWEPVENPPDATSETPMAQLVTKFMAPVLDFISLKK